MTLYTIHNAPNPASLPILIPHRFSWAAFIFGPIWLFSRRRWVLAALMLGFDFGLMIAGNLGFVSPWGTLLALLVPAILLGLEAFELDRRAEARRGRPVQSVASGANASDALARLTPAPGSEAQP